MGMGGREREREREGSRATPELFNVLEGPPQRVVHIHYRVLHDPWDESGGRGQRQDSGGGCKLTIGRV